jgi:hypothetical protein
MSFGADEAFDAGLAAPLINLLESGAYVRSNKPR